MSYTFLSEPLPSASKEKQRLAKVQWYGLNLKASADSGYISSGKNFYVTTDGTLRAVDTPVSFDESHKGEPLAFVGINDKLFYVYEKGDDYVDILTYNADGTAKTDNLSNTSDLSGVERSLARYNAWLGGSDIVNGSYSPRLIIYPDKKLIPLNGAFNLKDITQYKIVKITAVTKKINQKTYNQSLELNADKVWEYTEDKGYIIHVSKADGESNSIESETSEEVHSYCDEEPASMPEAESIQGDTKVSYYVSQTHGSDGKLFDMLTVETITTSTVISYRYDSVKTIIPDADFVTPYNNRIFGVDGTKIFASAAGSYVNYDLDTATDYDENNAWYSATQSGGDFTHICTFGGKVVAFKKDMLYELYNTKNPFRILEVNKIGTFTHKSVCELAGNLFYASDDGVYVYGGSAPYKISDTVLDKAQLDGGKFTYGVAGANDGKYYIREPLKGESGKPILVFDTATKTWSITDFNQEIAYFANADGHLYACTTSGAIYQMDSGNKAATEWYFETPVICESTADVKWLEKVQLVAKFHTAGQITVKVKYDNDTAYTTVATLDKDTGIHSLYAKVAKSDHVARFIRIECVGDVEILTFEQLLSGGGARYGG